MKIPLAAKTLRWHVCSEAMTMTRTLRKLLEGAATIFNLFPQSCANSPDILTFRMSDAELLRSDWESVGRDLSNAMALVDSVGASNEKSNKRRK